MMVTQIVLLNGTPSAGKTTLATALQRALPFPAFHLSLDEFRSGVRAEFWAADTRATLFRSMMRAHLRALAAVAAEGVPVIAESIILPESRRFYRPLFDDFDVTLVGVRCPLEVARIREAARTDRHTGLVDLDVVEFETVHEQDYSLEVDTAVEPTQASVDRILSRLLSDRAPA